MLQKFSIVLNAIVSQGPYCCVLNNKPFIENCINVLLFTLWTNLARLDFGFRLT